MRKDKLIPEMTEDIIINEWRVGFTIEQISKQYVKNRKQKGIKVTLQQAREYIWPIIFKYQTNLLKS